MIEVPNGQLVDAPVCPHQTYSAKNFAPDEEGVMKAKLESPQVQCYDQKAYSTASEEFTSLNASFTVPPLPTTNVGQTVFLWPGFKASEPVIRYPVLQPVLQDYGSGRWQVQSWGVGIPSGAMTGPRIDASPGDLITTYMNVVGDVWTVYAKNTRTGSETSLRLSRTQAGSQKYTNAVFVSENVMDRYHCDYYPANQGITFTDIVVNGNPDHGTQWQEGYDCGSPDCGQKVKQSDNGKTVQLTWNPSVSV